MAQFSSLEQMTNMAQDFNRLANLLSGSEATGALGKSVEVTEGDQVIQGVVKAVTRGAVPQVLVNGTYYNWEQVSKVYEE
jgi:flagellar basal-body rod modification protein FlgD